MVTRFWIETVDARARGFYAGWRYNSHPALTPDSTKHTNDRAEVFQPLIVSVAEWIDENPSDEMNGASRVLEARDRLNLLDYRLIRLCYGNATKGLRRDGGHIQFIRGQLDLFLKRDISTLDELFLAIQELIVYNDKYGPQLDLSALSEVHDELWAHALLEGAVNV